MKTISNSRTIPEGQLEGLQHHLCERVDEVCDALGIRVWKNRRMLYGCCPVHAGDNRSALNLYKEGHSLPGYWRCNTRHCEEVFRPTILGFVRGVLSQQENGWTNPPSGQPLFSFSKTIDWCCKFLGKKLWEVQIEDKELEKKRYASSINLFQTRPTESSLDISLPDVEKALVIPSPYFLQRGFSAQILKQYRIGDYRFVDRPLSDRAVVPVVSATAVLGFTGRSIFPKCELCQYWHKPGAACTAVSKWHNHLLNRDSILFNLHRAKKEIEKTGTVILCEGPMDVLRLEEAGYHNGVALLGLDLSDQQQILLEVAGTMKVVILTDMDEPGRKAAIAIGKRLAKSFRVSYPNLPKKDLGEMSVEEVRCLNLS
jgi:5S rRNA maturation endonuclease (ribonuclease M5)